MYFMYWNYYHFKLYSRYLHQALFMYIQQIPFFCCLFYCFILFICIHIYVYKYVHIYIYMIYVYIYVHVYIYMYICTYIYRHQYIFCLAFMWLHVFFLFGLKNLDVKIHAWARVYVDGIDSYKFVDNTIMVRGGAYRVQHFLYEHGMGVSIGSIDTSGYWNRSPWAWSHKCVNFGRSL